jgi:hypothetical protein
MANRIKRENNAAENVETAAELAGRAFNAGTTEQKEKTHLYSIRMSETDRNAIAGVFQQAGGMNFTTALIQSALYVKRQYEQGKVEITKNTVLNK